MRKGQKVIVTHGGGGFGVDVHALAKPWVGKVVRPPTGPEGWWPSTALVRKMEAPNRYSEFLVSVGHLTTKGTRPRAKKGGQDAGQ